MTSRRDGRVLLRLSAQGDLDAAVVVLERVRSRLRGIGCAQTDRQGRATVAFGARRGGSYLIAVGHVQNADPGTFRLDSLLSEAAESRSAGTRLARGGARSSVHGLTDVNDVWRVSMRPGVTYRIGFSSSPCAAVTLRSRRSLGRELARLTCDQYATFTPGPDGSLEYVLEVVANPAPVVQRYRLGLAAAGPDDLGVGVALRNRVPARGSLSPARSGRPRRLPLRRRSARRCQARRHRRPSLRARARRRHPAGGGVLVQAAARARPVRRRRHRRLRRRECPLHACAPDPGDHVDVAAARRGDDRAGSVGDPASRRCEGVVRVGHDPDRPIRPADGLAIQPAPARPRRRRR